MLSAACVITLLAGAHCAQAASSPEEGSVPALTGAQVTALIEQLYSAQPEVQEQAADALGRLGPAAADAVAALLQARSAGGNEGTRVAYKSLQALVAIGEPAVPAITAILRDERRLICRRRNMVQILSHLAHRHGATAIHGAAPDLIVITNEPQLVAGAAGLLGRMGPFAATAIPVLEREFESHPDMSTRLAVAVAVHEFLGDFQFLGGLCNVSCYG